MKKILLTLSLLSLTACTHFWQQAPEPARAVSNTLGEEQIITLTGAKMPCQFAKPMLCLVAMDEQNKAFGVAYDGIDNFRAEPNVRYKLKVRPRINQESIDSNGTTIVGFQLVEVLSQQ